MTAITDLIAAASRAQESGLTDEEQAIKSRAFALLNELYAACNAAHSETPEEVTRGEKLRTKDILWTLATMTAFYIGNFANGGEMGELIILGHHNQMILEMLSDLKKGA